MIQDEDLTGGIIKVFYKVYNTLGYGFAENVYHNSMLIELLDNGYSVETEKPIAVYYNNKIVGKFSADIVVEDKVILELKAKELIHFSFEAQLINYLRATDIEIGLLFNFGKTPEFKRKFFSNKNKQHKAPFLQNGDLLESLFVKNPFES